MQLDVCCGNGRHARALCERGYTVIAIDRDVAAIATARDRDAGASYIVADIREYESQPESFDAAIIMGQSFGHFDDATNRKILSSLAGAVRNSGRIILDVWNPEFFAAHQGRRDLNSSRGIVHENKRVTGDRLFVELDYPDGTGEKFEWQLFEAEEMERFGNALGLRLLIACSGFDAKNIRSPNHPRIQFVLQRVN